MARSISFWIFSILVSSCAQSPQKSATNLLVPKGNIKHLLDSFVAISGGKYKVYELYIDKISPNEYNLILYSGDESLTAREDSFYNNYPINTTETSKVKFKVYSGIEHFFHGSTGLGTRVADQHVLRNYEFDMWTVKDSAETLSIQESYGGYPFMPFPNKIPDSLSLKHSGKF